MKKWFKNNWIILSLVGSMACQVSESPKQEVALASIADTTIPEPTPPPVKTIDVDSTISIAYLMGQFDPDKDQRFVKVGAPYAQRGGMLLREEAYAALVKMAQAAATDGITLKILSATRNFDRQKEIWEAKWTGGRLVDGQNLAKTLKDPTARAQKILQWSSMPGSSRHHWGTDMDINALDNSYFASGRGQKEYEWLQAHASEYGFCQPYSPKGPERPAGYNEEKWHWSYLPLTLPLTQQAQLRLKNPMIQGFLGAETAEAIGIVENYVLGINQACR